MMVTFSMLYLVFYILILISLLLLSFLTVPFEFLSKFSLSIYFTTIERYTTTSFMILMNFLFLTGLPPFGLFLVKLNILTYVLYSNHFIVVLILFFVFLVNMFYYAQIFNSKNYKTKNYGLIKNSALKYFKTNQNNLKTQTYLTYNSFLMSVNVFFFFILNIFIYTDFFLITNL